MMYQLIRQQRMRLAGQKAPIDPSSALSENRSHISQYNSCSRRELLSKRDKWLYLSHLIESFCRTWTAGIHSMEIHTAHAQPLGNLIHEGHHKPFHALACPLNPQTIRAEKKK